MSKVLVTGANGFLGSWLVKQLESEGHNVSALVRNTSDLSELDGSKCIFIHGDITDRKSLDENFGGYDCIFHLAGLIAYKKSERKKMEEINVQGTANVIDSVLLHKIPRLVHVSSVVTIGAGFSDKEILDENSTYNIEHLDLGYFQTKRQAELLVLDAVKSRKLDAVILNPGTTYGPGDARKGSRKTQLKVAQGKFPFYTSGGVNVVAVEDVVGGIVSGWKKGRTGERYILGSDNILIKELFEIIANAACVDAPSIHLPNSIVHILGGLGDLCSDFGIKFPFSKENAWTSTLYHWFDSTKARKELDFNPKPSRDAIVASVKWIKENGLIS
jgi:dihydroflavonol-4-reductase